MPGHMICTEVLFEVKFSIEKFNLKFFSFLGDLASRLPYFTGLGRDSFELADDIMEVERYVNITKGCLMRPMTIYLS